MINVYLQAAWNYGIMSLLSVLSRAKLFGMDHNNFEILNDSSGKPGLNTGDVQAPTNTN